MMELFRRLVAVIDEVTAKPFATMAAFLLVIAWGVTGPRLHYSDSWQLLMTTTSAVVTFLMVFVLASAQRRNTMALHLKIDMLVAAHPELTNKAVGVESKTDEHVNEVRRELFEKIAEASDAESGAG